MKADWSKDNLYKIINESFSQKEVLEKLGIRNSGSNFHTLKKYINLYNISTSHFVKNYYKMVRDNILNKKETKDVLVKNSSFSRTHLKERLYREGILERKCCLCAQNEEWNGMKISLILDHINGIYNDNRIENLRIVCPNCNAGLDTFAGRNLKVKKSICFCGNKKNIKSDKCTICAGEKRRISERPPYEQLLKEIEELGYSGTGRKYGVSDNAVRKWIK